MALSGGILHGMALIQNEAAEHMSQHTCPNLTLLEGILLAFLLFESGNVGLVGGFAEIGGRINLFGIPWVMLDGKVFGEDLIRLDPCESVSSCDRLSQWAVNRGRFFSADNSGGFFSPKKPSPGGA